MSELVSIYNSRICRHACAGRHPENGILRRQGSDFVPGFVVIPAEAGIQKMVF